MMPSRYAAFSCIYFTANFCPPLCTFLQEGNDFEEIKKELINREDLHDGFVIVDYGYTKNDSGGKIIYIASQNQIEIKLLNKV